MIEAESLDTTLARPVHPVVPVDDGGDLIHLARRHRSACDVLAAHERELGRMSPCDPKRGDVIGFAVRAAGKRDRRLASILARPANSLTDAAVLALLAFYELDRLDAFDAAVDVGDSSLVAAIAKIRTAVAHAALMTAEVAHVALSDVGESDLPARLRRVCGRA